MELIQNSQGIILKYKGRVLTRAYLNKSGMNAAWAMAEALMVKLPSEGHGIKTVVSTGVLHRVLAISELDFRNEVSFEVAGSLILEAHSLRGTPSIEA